MGENCFVEVQYLNWFLSLIARVSSCFGSCIQNILATLRIVAARPELLLYPG